MNSGKCMHERQPRGVELRDEGMVSMAGGVSRRLLWLSGVAMVVAAVAVAVVAAALM